MDLVGTPNPMQVPSQPSQKKAVVKCEECRRKKIKCHPEWRDWTRGEKCTPCNNSHLACGPSVRKQPDAQSPAPPFYAPSPVTNPNSSFGTRIPSFHHDVLSDEPNAWMPTPFPSFAAAGSPQASSPPFIDSSVTMQSWSSFQLDKAHTELANMGTLSDVFLYLQGRRATLNKTNSTLPLINIDRVVTGLDMLALVIGSSFLNSFRKVNESCTILNGAEKELILHRLVNISSQYLSAARLTNQDDQANLTNRSEETPDSLSEEHDLAMKELLAIYSQRGDLSQVDRLKLLSCSVADLHGTDVTDTKTILARSQRISKAFFELLRDISPPYRSTLMPKGQLIVPAHSLAILGDSKCDLNAFSIDGSGSLQSVDILCRNALHVAVEVSNMEAVEWILAQPDASLLLQERDSLGLTPFHVAAYVGDLKVFEKLESQGAEPRIRDQGGRNVLCIAAMAGQVGIAKHLLSRGLSPNDSIQFCSPLHDAAAAGHIELARILLKYNAEPRLDHSAHAGRSPSQTAAEHGNHRLAQILRNAELAFDSQSPMEQITLEDLKQKVESALTRSRSPDSEHTSRVTVARIRKNPSKRERDESDCSSSSRRFSRTKKDRSFSQPPHRSRGKDSVTISPRASTQVVSTGTTDDPIFIPDGMFEPTVGAASALEDQFRDYSASISDILQVTAFSSADELWETGSSQPSSFFNLHGPQSP